ncbi:MAG: hypothetical protein NTX64_18240, partial [Elusimicrobia bacterium]|nr:hypothetical protein [Elusimicrobiota bacterium]
FSVYRLACLGKLRYRRLGPKTLLFSREDLLRYRERAGRERPRKGRPGPRMTAAGPALTARVQVDLESGRAGPASRPWRQFRWESVPLIRARLDSQYGKKLKGIRISVRGWEGDEWRVLYRAP